MGFGSGAVCDIRLNTKLSPEQRAKFQDTRVIRAVLGSSKVIAMVGMSTEPTKPSNMVASYLLDEGYTVVPVHPKADFILEQKVYRSLSEIPFPVDVVNVFRPSSEVAGLVDQALAIGAKAVWCQLRILDFEAGDKALDAGLSVVLDKCMKMEHGRFGGALHWAGMNTEVVTARRLR